MQAAEIPTSEERARDRIQERENAIKYRALLLGLLRERFDPSNPDAWIDTADLPTGAWAMVAKRNPRTFEAQFHTFWGERSNVWHLRLHADLRRQMRGVL